MNYLRTITFTLMLFSLLSVACQPAEKESVGADRSQAELERIESRTDTAAVNPDQSAFVFYEKDKLEQFLPRERIVFMVWDTMTDQAADLDPSVDRNIPEAEANRPPLFSRSCLQQEEAARPVCSYDAVQEYMQKNISYPVPAFTSEKRFIAYMSAVINGRGEVKGPIRLMDMQGERCAGCIEEARRLIRNMPAWQPARYQGEYVATRVSIPVYFRQVPDQES